MGEKEDQSTKVSSTTPGHEGRHFPSTQAPRPSPPKSQIDGSGLTLSSASLPQSSKPELGAVERVSPEEERKKEVDLNHLFPGKEYDLNQLFPDEGTKKLLYELRRNKRDIDRFIKHLDQEEE